MHKFYYQRLNQILFMAYFYWRLGKAIKVVVNSKLHRTCMYYRTELTSLYYFNLKPPTYRTPFNYGYATHLPPPL